MSTASHPTVEAIVPILGDFDDVGITLKSLIAQRRDGIHLSILIVAGPDNGPSIDSLTSVDPSIRAIVASGSTRGALLREAFSGGTSEFVAIVSPGETPTHGALAAMARALRSDAAADIACVPSLPAVRLLDNPYTPPSDRDWPEHTSARDIRSFWWSARRTLRGTLVRRGALPTDLDTDATYWGAEQHAMLRMQRANPRVVFCTGERIALHRADEYQARLFQGAFDLEWYVEPITRSWPTWLEEFDGDAGIDRFVQALALSAVAARFSANADNLNKRLLLDDDLDRFMQQCAQVLANVDDELLLDPDSRSKAGLSAGLALTLYLVKTRCAQPTYTIEEATLADRMRGSALFVDGELFEPAADQTTKVALIDWDAARNELIIDGRVSGFAWLAGSGYVARVKTKRRGAAAEKIAEIALDHREWYSLTKYFGIASTKTWAFRVRIPIPKDAEKVDIAFAAEHANPMNVTFVGHFCRIARHPRRMWWAFGDHMMYHRLGHIVVERRTPLRLAANEAVVMLSLLQGSKFAHRRAYNRRAVLKRLAYWLTYPFFAGKQRWFFVDKVYKAGDSSEYLYRYSSAQDDGILKDYAISKKAPDYSRLVEDGYRPLKAGTLRHLLTFLHADLVFASNSTVTSLNGLKSWRSAPFRGLIHFDTVCTQHGLSIQDVAIAQNRLVDNTRLYLLASHVEATNLERPVYAYDDYAHALQLTGMPRYDGLVSDDRRQILIHPTWRMQFAMPVATHEGEARPYNPTFKDSPYFKTYASLIQNRELLACARETGYAIKYVLHPIASSQLRDFPQDGEVEILGASGDLNYEEVLTRSSLMVTDYSGVQFDFAYMRKPVVYYHPVELPPHYEVSAFSYDTMAFGEICRTEAGLVDLLCQYMRADCRMKPAYAERVNSFFAFDDRDNCERSYRAALDYMRHRTERR